MKNDVLFLFAAFGVIFGLAIGVALWSNHVSPAIPNTPKTIQAVEVRPMENFSGGAGKYLVECKGGCRAVVLTNTSCTEVKGKEYSATTVTPKLKVVHGDYSGQTVLYSTPDANGQWVIAPEAIPYEVKHLKSGQSSFYTCTAEAEFTVFFGEKGGVVTTYP